MKPLSPNNILDILLFPVLLTVMMPVIVQFIPVVVSIVLSITLIGWIVIGVKDTYNLHFDEDFLYLESIIDRKKIPLSAIEKIRRSEKGMIVRGVTSWHYEIKFNAYAKMKDQSFSEVHGGKRVLEFVETVRKRNSSVVAQLS